MQDNRDGFDIQGVMDRIPTAARMYYTGTPGGRRYRRASVLAGPGEALVFRSHVERELQRLAAELRQARGEERAPVQKDST